MPISYGSVLENPLYRLGFPNESTFLSSISCGHKIGAIAIILLRRPLFS